MNTDLHAFTPTLHVIDPRGLAITRVAFYRHAASDDAHPRVERYAYTAAGYPAQQWDARLQAHNGHAQAPNQSAVRSLSGRALRTHSVDAGPRVTLLGVAGQVLEHWDARHTHGHIHYDEQLRPVIVEERTPASGLRVCERLTYGDATQAATNRCARLIRHDDPAGSLELMACGLTGQPLAHTRYFLADTQPPDWPSLPAQRKTLLEHDERGALRPFTTAWHYDALGTVLCQTDARGNRQQHHYDASGQLAVSRLTPADDARPVTLLHGRVYGPAGQVLSETLGNGVTTTFTFAPTDGRLQQLKCTRASSVLQHLSYVYDPVGNALSITDAAQPTDWFKGEQVEAVNRYTYDTLYQLVETSGRESLHAGIHPRLPGLVLPGGGDASRRRNYTQTYRYDAAGNLLTLKHGQNPVRTLKVDAHSNRSLHVVDPDNPPDIGKGFDANGNMLHLEGAQQMHWDARNQLQRVTQVLRVHGPHDDETYVYSASGQRLRKIRAQQTRAVRHVAEVRYLPGLELRTSTATGEVLQVVTVQAGTFHVRRLHWEARRKTLPATQWRYSASDHLASITLELDAQGDVVSHEGYYPYGGSAWWAARHETDAAYKTRRYSGKERDATGLYYYGLRYYAPWLQRWINPDPMGDVDGLNLFAMVHGNPITQVDVQGALTSPSDILRAAGASLVRDGFASAAGATLRHYATAGLSRLEVNTASITVTSLAGVVLGGAAGAYAGAGVGAELAYRRFNASRASDLGALIGGVLGAVAGAAPSVVGWISAMASLNTDQPTHNLAAIGMIGATVNASTREMAQRTVAEVGPRVAWNARPQLDGLAISAAVYGVSLAGIGALEHVIPDAAARSITASTAGEMLGGLGGVVTRGRHDDATYTSGSNRLTHPLAASQRMGALHGVASRMSASASSALLGLGVTHTGLNPDSIQGHSAARALSVLSEGRLLVASYVLDGFASTTRAVSSADINADTGTMNPRRQWVAHNNDDRGIQMHVMRRHPA